MNSNEALNIVTSLNIPKPVLARLAGLHDQTVYNFLDGKSVSTLNAYKITTALGELSRWITALPFPPDMRNWRAVADAVGKYRVEHLKEAGVVKVREEFGVRLDMGLDAATQSAIQATGVTAGLGSKK